MKENWIALGEHLFIIDEIYDVHIQKGHLVISLDNSSDWSKRQQIVIYFPGKDQNEKAKKVFGQICKLKEASMIELPDDVNFQPDLMETFYGDKYRREVTERVQYENGKFKKRHMRKKKRYLPQLHLQS